MKISAKWQTAIIIWLIILYGVGVAGFIYQPTLFQQLTPYNLLLSSVIAFLFHRQWTKQFFMWLFGVFIVGFIVEWVGVHTAMPFGPYHYESGLGYQIDGIPLLIGLNWVFLTYCTATIAKQMGAHPLIQAIAGAMMMLLLDIFLEPFAIKFHLWQWDSIDIPTQNYVSWFVIAFVFQLPFQNGQYWYSNSVAQATYAIQLLFFIALRMMIL